MITLYGVPRSRTFRALWMLEELGLQYENVKTHFATGDTRKPEYLKINPNGHIPALQDGDVTLFESMAINLYLARKYDKGKGLWPTSVEDEGRTYQWSVWAMTELEGPLLDVLMHRLILPEGQRDTKKAEDGIERCKKPLAVLNDALAGKPYLLGKTFTTADLNVAAVMSWATLSGVDLSAAPNVQGWVGRCLGRPALAKASGG